MIGELDRAAIFNPCAAARRCDAKGPQVCREGLGQVRKEAKKKMRNKTSPKSMISIIFKTNTMIRILAIELLKHNLITRLFNDGMP
jgi:hypothetical protein